MWMQFKKQMQNLSGETGDNKANEEQVWENMFFRNVIFMENEFCDKGEGIKATCTNISVSRELTICYRLLIFLGLPWWLRW